MLLSCLHGLVVFPSKFPEYIIWPELAGPSPKFTNRVTQNLVTDSFVKPEMGRSTFSALPHLLISKHVGLLEGEKN